MSADPARELAQRSVTLRFASEHMRTQPATTPVPAWANALIDEWSMTLESENKSPKTIRCYTDVAANRLGHHVTLAEHAPFV